MNNKNLAVLNDAIYYPFIELPNDSWLRTSILFWDTINPIIPEPIYSKLKPDSLFKILESNGVAAPVLPYELFYTPEKIELFTESILTYASTFQPQKSPEEDMAIYDEIHVMKMPSVLAKKLNKKKLLWEKKNDEYWFYFYKPLSAIFMAELARNLAIEKKMFPITNEESFGKSIFGQTQNVKNSFFEKIFGAFNKTTQNEIDVNKSQLAIDFLFKNILPTPSAEFDIDTLLRIKSDNKEHFYNFRNSFRNVISKINKLETEVEILSELQQFSDKIESDSLKLKDIFATYERNILFNDLGAVLSTDKPLSFLIKAGLVVGGVTISPILIAGLVFYGVFEAYKGRTELETKRKESIRSCEGAYIFKVKNALSGYVSEQY